ncbi:MAG: hypothetical protein Q8M99_11735 [Methylotenera sp.]|nr:hypothetical protein [Methylotenera sp.]
MNQITKPDLQDGETYLCAYVNEDGSVTYTILMPESKIDINWKDAMAWAKELGGDLPTRAELIHLYENHADKFELRWYWSNTQPASYSSNAWCQHCSNGYQYCYYKFYELRARAVRRLVIQ